MTFKSDLDLQPTNRRIFFHKQSKSKKSCFFGGGGGGVEGGGVGGEGGAGAGRWMNRGTQSQTNLPLHCFGSWGHNNALMYKLCP